MTSEAVAPQLGASARYRYPICVYEQADIEDCEDKRVKDKGWNARVIERLNGILNSLCAESQCTVRQPGRARNTLEFGHALRFLTVREKKVRGAVQ